MKIKRLLSLIVTLVIVFCCVSCRGPQGDPVDTSKVTVLKVSNYGGGFGSDWLEEVKARFEAEYADYSFEEGKAGVYIDIDDAKNNGEALLNNNLLDPDMPHVFFNECIDYDQFIAQGYALDITDAIKEKLPGEETSVFDKFSDDQKTYLDKNGKYYMIPHYAGFNGITIDVDLFNEKKLFMDTNGNCSKQLTDEGKSYGPDGKANTYDDGLPATLDDFYKLMATMAQRSVTPFVWSADHQFYATRMAEAFAADVNGATNTKIGYTFDGTLDNIVKSVAADGTVTTESVAITNANGYDVVKQEGYYYSLKLLEKIVDGGYYNSQYCFDGGTHLETQKRFLQSNTPLAAEAGNNPIAMMIEGCWWEGEATATFTAMEKQNTADRKYGKKDRNFMFMPFPKATAEKVGESVTLLETLRSYGFVNAYLENNEPIKKLAVLFLQYCNTDVSLKEFTKITSAVRTLNYEMDAESLVSCSPYCKSLLNLKNAEGTTIVYPLSNNMLFRTTTKSHINGSRYSNDKGGDPTSIFKNNESYTAAEYFNGMYSFLKNDWALKYSSYIKG